MNFWIVTGASSGIGFEMVLVLLNQGKKVIGLSRKKPAIDHVNFSFFPMDLEKIDDLEKLPFKCQDLEGVIFCHGIGIFKKFEEFSFNAIEKIMNINLYSTILLTKHFLPYLKKTPSGYLIYIGSEAGLEGKIRSSIYSASKFALRGFFQSIRQESASSNLKVISIQPGMTRTAFYENLNFEPKEDEKCAIDPKDIAQLIPWITSCKIGSCPDEIVMNPQAYALKFKPSTTS